MHGYQLEFLDSMHSANHDSDDKHKEATAHHEEAHSPSEQGNHHGPTFKWLVHIDHAAHGDDHAITGSHESEQTCW